MPTSIVDNLLRRSSASLYLDRSGRILKAVGVTGVLLNGDSAAAIGQELSTFLEPGHAPSVQEVIDRCLSTGGVESVLFRLAADSEPRQLLFAPVDPKAADNPKGAVVKVQDVTAALRKPEVSDLSHDLFNSILQDLGEGIVVFDRSLHITHINEPALRLMWSHTDAEGGAAPHTLSEYDARLIPDDAEMKRLLDSGREFHKVVQIEDGPVRRGSILLNFYPVKDNDGSVISVVQTLQDISHEAKTADKIQQVYSRLQEKVRVLSVLNKLSNDFNLCTAGEQLYPRITRTLVWGLGLNDTAAVLSLREEPEAPVRLRSFFGVEEAQALELMAKPDALPVNRIVDHGLEKYPQFTALGLASAIYSPIVMDGNEMGYLCLFHRSRDLAVAPEETLVRILSENLQHFIRRWRAEQQLRNKVLALTVLRQISDAFQVGRSLEQVAYSFLTGVTAEQGLGFNRAFLFLLDEQAERLEGQLGIGPASPEEASRIWGRLRSEGVDFATLLTDFDKIDILRKTHLNKLIQDFRVQYNDRSVLFRVLEGTTSELFHIGNVEHRGERIMLTELGCDEFVVCPLLGTDRPIGVLLTDNEITHRPIEPDDRHFLELICKAAQSALENIQLNEELQRKVETLKRSNILLQEHRAQLAKLERLGALGEMAASVAHEIRNPLVSIGGFARTLLEDVAPEDSDYKYLKIIVDEVNRLETVVTELLDFAKPIRPKFRTVLIRDMVLQTVAMVEPEYADASVKIATQLDRMGTKAWVDPDLMKHVLLNLMHNAMLAMPGGGKLTIFTRTGKEMVHIGVKDTGVGIAKDSFEQIFEPFYTTRSSGTGLGLTIVQRIVRSHGGKVSVKSSVGAGTTFLVSLPYGEYPGGASR